MAKKEVKKVTKKVVIMAAGKGVRMLPLTKLVPKPLISVNNKPFLLYLLKHLKKAGYTEIAIIVGYKNEMIKKFLKEHNLKATLLLQKRRMGTGHALKLSEKFVGNSNFIVVGGDNLWSVKDLSSIPKDDNLSYIATITSKNPERYGVIVEENGYLSKIVEKPQIFVNDQINTGLYKFTPEIFDKLKKIKKSVRGEYELTDAITLLAQEHKVKLVKIHDYWLDLGKIPDIETIGKFLKQKGE